MMKSWGALVLLACANAHAFVVHDVESLTLPVDGEKTCVVFPAEAADPKICGHVDLDAMRQLVDQNMAPLAAGGGKMLAVAMVRHDPAVSIVLITRMPLHGREPLASDSIRRDLVDTVAGLGDSLGHELVPATGTEQTPYERIAIAGTVGIRSTLVSAGPLVPLPGIDRVLYYRIFSPGNSFWMAAITSRAEQARVSELIEGWLGRSTVTPLTSEQWREFDQPSYYERGYRTGFILGRSLLVGLVLLLLFGIVRWVAKRRAR